MANVSWVVEFLVVDGPASPILGMDFFVRNGVVLDFTNTVVWSKELVNGVQVTEAVVGNAPNLPPGFIILVEGSMDNLVSGTIGVASTYPHCGG